VQKIRAGLDMADDAFEFVKDVQENGVAAIWKHIESQLGNLWDTLLGMAKDWIVTTIIEKATAKLLSMLDPTGIMAVVNSGIAFFNAVQSVIEYVREILQIVNDYVTTLAAVAAGNISAGAAKVERGLANAIPVAIGFLANQAGLGNVPEKLVELIGQLRELIDKALDWLFEQAMRLGRAALNALGVGGPADAPESAAATTENVAPFDVDGFDHKVTVQGDALIVSSTPQPVPQLVANILEAVWPPREKEAREVAAQIYGLLPSIATTVDPTQRRMLLGVLAGFIKRLVMMMDYKKLPNARHKSVGTAWYDINGQRGTVAAISGSGIDQPVSRSGKAEEVEYEQGMNLFFSSLILPSKKTIRKGATPAMVPRHTDSELKILEYVAQKFTPPATAGSDTVRNTERYDGVHGMVQMHTDYHMCESCAFVVAQFQRLFNGNVVVNPEVGVEPHAELVS
jgi:hypothetical protein